MARREHGSGPVVTAAGSPSSTATLVAASVAFLGRDPRLADVLPPGAAEATWQYLQAWTPGTARLVRQCSRRPLRGVVTALEGLVIPGIQLHYAARKRFIADEAAAFMRAGGQRVVVIGAGLDTLGLRLARDRPALQVIELDHPSAPRLRRRPTGDLAPANLLLVPADLREQPIDPLLQGIGGDGPAPRTLVVLEGVTMYLTSQEVRQALSGCARTAPPGSRLIFTFLVPDRGRLQFRGSRRSLVAAWLMSRGEPFRWGVGADDVGPFVAGLGWRLLRVVGTPELRRAYLAPRGLRDRLAVGEAIAVCEVTA